MTKKKKRMGDKAEFCGTPLSIGTKGDIDESTITSKDRSERKLKRFHRTGGKTEEW